MPRNLDAAMLTALQGGVIVPAILAQITFRSGVQYIWTGVGTLSFGGNNYLGVGTLGTIGTVTEGTEVRADGTTVSLSGIDPTLYADCLTEIQLGAPAKLWFALLGQGVIIGAPYLLFSGLVDKPTISTGADSINISLALETRLTNLQRPTARRYTAADQHANGHPDDTGFNFVELLNDIALRWGS